MTDPSADDRYAEDRGGEFLTVEQMAQLRQVTPAAIRAQLRAGTLAGEQVLQGQRTVWRIPASAVRRSLEEPGRSAAAPDPVVPPAAPPAGARAAAPVAPSAPDPTPPATGRAVSDAPAASPAARVAALEAEVRRLRRQVVALADAHHRLLDALTADAAEDLPR